ncbi:hypothetical protein ASPZODRAFT_136087 [Penicilliopsis zonata CBS 506.65]|uniref:Major facilitator superfamily (MFS) profile domain-containing protein n=1 Tax=Penicilliopsis zonata CBS 506.65 TaxID=1073090 RepID=A0A1L9S905_9EURO|nr:hypothetical protein ASPZODRAFT_136087 [Penicilliopsis zonata CBS 506.65]OJJ43637.1 hypothetical protein ASPZODRAFT_136087 [Penicilliopsis zonata CBS 506.65]
MSDSKVEHGEHGNGQDELAAVLPENVSWTSPHLFKLNFCVISLILFSSTVGYDGSLVNGLEALDRWLEFMDNPSSTWLGFVNAIYWLGAMVSNLAAGSVTTRYGAKISIWMGIFFLTVGTIVQTVAPNDKAFIVARFLVGMALGWFTNGAPVLINEISYPSHRGIASALYMCGYYVGAIVSAWATFATRTYDDSWCWRLPSLLQLLCPLLAIPGLLLTPASPRWLISVGRIEEARQALANLHTQGDAQAPLITYEVNDIQATIAAEKEAQESSGYAEMLKTPGNRHRLFISITLGIYSQWVGNGVVSYYLAMVLDTIGITQTRDQLLISACLQIWNLIFAVVGASLVDKLGRRILFSASAGIMLTSYIIITGLSGSFARTGSGPVGTAVIPFLFIYFAGYDIALTPMLTAYPCEIWPFRLRSRGLTVTWAAAILGIFFNTFINPIALAAIGWKYYIVFVAVLLSYAIVTFMWYPETRGYSLEHMAVIFDGDGAAVATTQQTMKTVTDAILNEEEKKDGMGKAEETEHA